MGALNYIEKLSDEIWKFTGDLFVLVSIITIISVLVVWFVTESYEKIIIKKKMNKCFKWLISIFVVSGISYLLVLLFRDMQMNKTAIYYIILLSLFSAATTMFIYLKGIKILFKLIDTLTIRVETLYISEKEEKLAAQNDLIKNAIIRDQLIVRKEAEDETID
jgi:hypothetical protein